MLADELDARLHHHPDRRRRRVPDARRAPTRGSRTSVGVEVALVDDARDAVRERRDDAVGGAGDPAGVGRAPEDVVRVEVERELAGDVVRDDGPVDVHGAFRRAGRAAREVEESDVLGVGGRDLERVVGLRRASRR